MTEPAAESELRRPRPGQHFRWEAFVTLGDLGPDVGPVLVGPGGLHQLGPQVGVAGLGDVAPAGRAARGVLGGDQTHEAHQRRRPSEAAPVAHLGMQRERPHPGHPPVGAEAAHRVGEQLVALPGDQVRLHRSQGGVSGQDSGPVVPEGHGQRGFVEALGHQPRLVLVRPGRPASIHPRVAQQELRQAVAGPGQVLDHVGPGAAQVPHRLLHRRRDPDGDEFPGPVQAGQAPTVPLVGLDLVARRPGDHRGGDHLAAHAHRPQQPRQVIAGGAGLITDTQQPGLGEPAHQTADGLLVVEDLLDVGAVMARVQDPRRDRVPVDVQPDKDGVRVGKIGHGRLLPYVGSAAMVDDPRICGTGPAVSC